MAVDRQAARRRVGVITRWAAAGAAALTGAFAVGAAHGGHAAASATTHARVTTDAGSGSATAALDPGMTQGYAPPTTSSAPPQAMSGGS